MTRQVFHVFFGNCRLNLGPTTGSEQRTVEHGGEPASKHPHVELPTHPHESPRTMTVPLIILAVCSVLLGFLGTPAWPWFQSFLGQHHGEGFTGDVVSLMILSSVVVFAGLGLGWWLYGRRPLVQSSAPDPLEKLPAGSYMWLQRKYGIDELYEISVIRFNAWFARVCAFLDQWVWGAVVALISYLAVGLGWASDGFDKFVINLGFDQSCEGVTRGGWLMSRLQNGRVQNYLRIIGVALAALVLILIWGGGK
jgi:NADH-quinone oxidoreductase subunit L